MKRDGEEAEGRSPRLNIGIGRCVAWVHQGTRWVSHPAPRGPESRKQRAVGSLVLERVMVKQDGRGGDRVGGPFVSRRTSDSTSRCPAIPAFRGGPVCHRDLPNWGVPPLACRDGPFVRGLMSTPEQEVKPVGSSLRPPRPLRALRSWRRAALSGSSGD